MKTTHQTYVKYLFNDFAHFASGISFKFSTNKYHFLAKLAGCTFFTHDIEWTEKQILEAINVFFHICNQDKDIADHIKRLVGVTTQTALRPIDSDSFKTHKLYGDTVCIKIAEAFGIVATAKNGNHIVFSDWIDAIEEELNQSSNNNVPFYSNILRLGKTIRNKVAHNPNEEISRTKWVPTLTFLLNSYICLCLLLIYVKGNPFSQTEPGIVDLQTEDVVISTDANTVVIILEKTDSDINMVHADDAPTRMRSVKLKKYTKYTIKIGPQTYEVELVATDRAIHIDICCATNVLEIKGDADIIAISTLATNTPMSMSINVPGSNGSNIWKELTSALSKLYASGTLMYGLFPAMNNADLPKLLSNPDAPCEGAFNERVKSFGEHLKLVSEVVSKISLDDKTRDEYLERVKKIYSKVRMLGYNNTHLEMCDLASLEELLYGIGDILCNNAPIARLISARLATSIGHCDDANTNAFFFMGNTIYQNMDNSQLWNVGAAILHDLYMIIPEEFRCQVKPSFTDALASAENQWDMYYVRFKK